MPSLASHVSRPRLRSVEAILVPDREHGRVLMLRDTQGIAAGHAVIPPGLIPLVARFDGRPLEDLTQDLEREKGLIVPREVAERLVEELDRGLFLEGPTFERERQRVEFEFRTSTIRQASHAGGAYHSERNKLEVYLEEQCFEKATSSEQESGTLVGLIAPHIDPWRGAQSYGHAYSLVRERLSPEVDTFVLLGTSHAPMEEPFALSKKTFETPLGDLAPDVDAIEFLEKGARFDPYRDELNHKREHSIEFQAVFLRYLLPRARKARIVPILASLGAHQTRGTSPEDDAGVQRFLEQLAELVEARQGRVLVVAGADLAHVGPRFGDRSPYDAQARRELEAHDRESLRLTDGARAAEFWKQVSGDLDTRRVCGLAPIYTLLKSLPNSRARLRHYEQTVDNEDASIVSHAAVGLFSGKT